MAKYSKDAAVEESLLRERSSGLAISEELRRPPASKGKDAEFDFRGQLDRMAADARRDQTRPDNILRITDFDAATTLIDGGSLLTASDRLLHEARRLIEEQRFREALVPLNTLLGEQPAHHDAVYLAAYCWAHLNETDIDNDTRALLLLRRLRGARLNPTLDARVNSLVDRLRSRRAIPVAVHCMALIDTENVNAAVTLLLGEIELDPVPRIYYYMLAGSFLKADRLEEAVAAARTSLDGCADGDRQHFEQLLSAAQDQLVKRALEPARQLYKRRKYAQAHAAVLKISGGAREHRLYGLFEGYLRQLHSSDGGFFSTLFAKAKTPVQVTPSGTPADLDLLGFFLTRDELAAGRAILYDQHHDLTKARKAELLLTEAMNLAPFFLYAHYLAGTARLMRVLEQVGTDQQPDLSTLETELLATRDEIALGARDPDIDASHDLKTVGELLTTIGQVKDRQRAFEELKAIDALVGDGIRDAEHARQILSRLANLKQRIPALKKAAQGEAKPLVAQLENAIDDRRAQLNKLLPKLDDDAVLVTHTSTLTSVITGLKHNPITSLERHRSLLALMQNLRRKAQTDRGRLKLEESLQTMDTLLQQIDQFIALLSRQG